MPSHRAFLQGWRPSLLLPSPRWGWWGDGGSTVQLLLLSTEPWHARSRGPVFPHKLLAVSELDPDGWFAFAYNAALQLATAYLRLHGLRVPATGRHAPTFRELHDLITRPLLRSGVRPGTAPSSAASREGRVPSLGAPRRVTRGACAVRGRGGNSTPQPRGWPGRSEASPVPHPAEAGGSHRAQPRLRRCAQSAAGHRGRDRTR